MDMEATVNGIVRQFRDYEQPSCTAYTPSAEAMRLDNAINRGLEQPDSPEAVMALIADAQQVETDLEEQAARRRQMWDSIMECAVGYTEFDNELVRQVIQKIAVEDAETIRVQFRDSKTVIEQEIYE